MDSEGVFYSFKEEIFLSPKKGTEEAEDNRSKVAFSVNVLWCIIVLRLLYGTLLLYRVTALETSLIQEQ